MGLNAQYLIDLPEKEIREIIKIKDATTASTKQTSIN